MSTRRTKINRGVLLFCTVFTALWLTGQPKPLEEQSAEELYQNARTVYRTNPHEAIALADEAASRAIQDKDVRTIGNAYFLMGYIYKNLDDIPNAFHYYFGAIRAFQRIDDPMRIQQLYGNMAFIAELKGVHTISEQLRKDRLKLINEVSYPVQADMHYDLGLSLKHQGDIVEAMTAQMRALAILEKNPNLADTSMYANIWLEMGVLNYLQGKSTNEMAFIDSALLCYNRAQHFNGGDVIHLSKVKNNKGNALRIFGQFHEAKQLFFESIRLSGSYEKRKISPYFNLGRVYYSEGQVDSAIWAFTRSLEINIGDLSYLEAQDLPQLNIELSKTDELFGSVQYLDSLGIKDLEIRGRAMRHVYRMARERYEIINANNNSMIAQLYDKHKQELVAQERWETVRTWGLMILLILAVGSAFWFWWKRWSVRRHNRRLAIQMEKRLKERYGMELKD